MGVRNTRLPVGERKVSDYQLERASTEDYMKAVNTDGTPVDIDRVMTSYIFNKRYEDVTQKDLKSAKYARAYSYRRHF